MLHPDLDAASIERLRASAAPRRIPAEVEFHTLDIGRFKGMLRSRAISLTAYGRLLFADLVPASVQRLVYVDGDVIFEPDIAELFDLELRDHVIAAVPNGTPEDQRANAERIRLATSSYFASGLMVIDLEQWRRTPVGDRAMRFAAEEAARLRLHDQDALNWALQGDFLPLPDRWCHWSTQPRTDERPVLVHFAMSRKPWHPDYVGGFQSEFFSVLDRTPFAGWRPPSLFGLAPLLSRIRRRIPYLPTIVRLIRQRLGG